jgi:hypothetical protein
MDMKGWMGGFLLLMLVVSVPVWAEETRIRAALDSDDIEVRTETRTENEGDDSALRVRTETRTEYKDGMLTVREERRVEFDGLREQIKLRMQNGTNVTVRELVEYRKGVLEQVKERREDLREDRKEFMEQARERVKEERKELDELRGKYSERRDGFIEAREKLKDDCESPRSDECKTARQELNVEAKGFMGNAAEQMLRIIETLKVRVEANTAIGDETAADVIAQLDTRALAIEQAQAKIDAINGTDINTTKQAADELRTAWSEARVSIRLAEGLLTHAKFQDFLDQLERMETRFTEARDRLAAEGKDVTQLDADIAAFSAKIDVATESYVSARDSYVSAMATAKTEADANALLKSTRDQLKASHEDVKEARDDLREIIKDIRALSPEVFVETAVKLKEDREAEVELEVEA